jgi:hypothetical protein
MRRRGFLLTALATSGFCWGAKAQNGEAASHDDPASDAIRNLLTDRTQPGADSRPGSLLATMKLGSPCRTGISRRRPALGRCGRRRTICCASWLRARAGRKRR